MPTLKKLLKKSLKKVEAGKGFDKLVPVDLPKGLKQTREGEFILPKKPAECADLLYQLREERHALQRRADRLKEAETALSDFFINTLPRSDATGIAGRVARVQIEIKPVPQVADWDRLYAYIKANDAFELVQRRLGEGAAKELLDAGEGAKAGLTVFQAKKISCTRL